MRKQIVLSLAHYIYLTRDQRYALHEGERLDVVGVTLPVWFYRGDTSEPAVEVFGQYIIDNKQDEDCIIYTIPTGYQFNLPQLPQDYQKAELSDERWRAMSFQERNNWYEENKSPLNSKCLLDPVDGGGAYLHWTQHNKRVKGNRVLAIKNYVEIKDMSKLEDSLCF